MTERKLAVIGSPIAHSRSPLIHRAAYEALQLDWSYDRFDVTEAGFEQFMNHLSDDFLGLSVTMPLKRLAHALAQERDIFARETGVANTLLRTEQGWAAFNTDVRGAAAVIESMHLGSSSRALILGAGATAQSMVTVLAHLGFSRLDVLARRAEQLAQLKDFAIRYQRDVQPHTLPALASRDLSNLIRHTDIVINTLPGDASAQIGIAATDARQTALFDINYDPWPSPLCQLWSSVESQHADGLELLVQQAVYQIRIFLSGDPTQAIPREAEVIGIMRAASMER